MPAGVGTPADRLLEQAIKGSRVRPTEQYSQSLLAHCVASILACLRQVRQAVQQDTSAPVTALTLLASMDGVNVSAFTEEQRETNLVAVRTAADNAAKAAAAYAFPYTPVSTLPDCGMMPWQQWGGDQLEPALKIDPQLGSSPIRLVDAQFLINLARLGGRLVPRQELPDDAFIDLPALQNLGGGGSRGYCLRVIGISHCWLQPDSPDPLGTNLRLLGDILELFVEYESSATGDRVCPGQYGVFIDFCSLHQKPAKGARTTVEEELFKRGLKHLDIIYSHASTIILRLTKMPDFYPEGFIFPMNSAPNIAAYMDRGWCFCEAAMCNLIKDSNLNLDLGNLTGTEQGLIKVMRRGMATREPPLLPSDFDSLVRKKSFTSKSADEAVVSGLYHRAFLDRLSTAQWLYLGDVNWHDEHLASFAKVVATGLLSKLRRLELTDNFFSDEGIVAFLGAGGRGKLTGLKWLGLHSSRDMIRYNAVLRETQRSPPGAMVGHALVESIRIGSFPSLKLLQVDATAQTPQLKALCLECGIALPLDRPESGKMQRQLMAEGAI